LNRRYILNYQVGQTGRVVIAKFDDGDNILKGLSDIAKKEDIRAAVFYLVGGMRAGKFVVGPEKEELPPVPVWRELKESHEIIGLGTIFWHNDEPKVHFHGAFGKRDDVRVGCMRESTEAFLVLEAVVIEIKGVNAVRELDPLSNMVLLKL
jgi:predicted DNA-binding protein with PD1-like motif